MPTLVPAMVVQPLVENAIQHGIRQRKEPGHIHICARKVDGVCLVEVKDDGPGVSTHSGMGQAMLLLHDRLAKLYGDGNYELTLQRDPRSQETIASLSVPLWDGARAG
jgi:LytS/YehU family sensor histidine kinase